MRGGPQLDETPLHALRLMGLPPHEIEKVRQVLQERARRELFEVWPEHWQAVCTFMAMQTQWLSRGGLNYAALPAVEERMPRQPRALRQPPSTVFAQLRVMERAVLEHWADQAR